MPTATTTITADSYNSAKSLKMNVRLSASPSSPTYPASATTSPSSVAPLRSLYNRAARAFLHREIPLTHSLIESAFHLLKPPVTVHDNLVEQRRKWDILRITLETTIYADPPSKDGLPGSLLSILTQSPQTLMASIYSRSVALFTPSSATSQKSTRNAGCLPSSVLITLVYSSLKLDCPEIGRMMTEDWLSRRESYMVLNDFANPGDDSEEGGYDKVLEIYCLTVLPKLEQWDYSKEFLQFESELSEPRREFLKSRLNAQYAEAMASRSPKSPSPSSSNAPTPRCHSPAPSASSSSSLSTTSTHTIMPSTVRAAQKVSSNLRQSSANHSSSSSDSSEGTATPRGKSKATAIPNGHSAQSRSAVRTANSSSTSTSSAVSSTSPRTDVRTTTTVTSQNPTILSLVKQALAPHLTKSKIATFVILFVLFPLLSWVLRVRRRKRKLQLELGSSTPLLGAPGSTNVDLVRKRLQAAGRSDSNIVTKVWREAFRAVTDTVMMAGKGLV